LITKAVFPVGGLGTRFLPATKAIPKEMLPVVDKPLIQYAVEEAYAAGVREMIFVTGRHKRAIEDHFDTAYELEAELEQANKKALLDLVHSIKPDDMDCVYVRQPRALGLGHAVLCAERLVGDEPFAVLLADDLMLGRDQASGGATVLQQMVRAYEQHQGTIWRCKTSRAQRPVATGWWMSAGSMNRWPRCSAWWRSRFPKWRRPRWPWPGATSSPLPCLKAFAVSPEALAVKSS